MDESFMSIQSHEEPADSVWKDVDSIAGDSEHGSRRFSLDEDEELFVNEQMDSFPSPSNFPPAMKKPSFFESFGSAKSNKSIHSEKEPMPYDFAKSTSYLPDFLKMKFLHKVSTLVWFSLVVAVLFGVDYFNDGIIYKRFSKDILPKHQVHNIPHVTQAINLQVIEPLPQESVREDDQFKLTLAPSDTKEDFIVVKNQMISEPVIDNQVDTVSNAEDVATEEPVPLETTTSSSSIEVLNNADTITVTDEGGTVTIEATTTIPEEQTNPVEPMIVEVVDSGVVISEVTEENSIVIEKVIDTPVISSSSEAVEAPKSTETPAPSTVIGNDVDFNFYFAVGFAVLAVIFSFSENSTAQNLQAGGVINDLSEDSSIVRSADYDEKAHRNANNIVTPSHPQDFPSESIAQSSITTEQDSNVIQVTLNIPQQEIHKISPVHHASESPLNQSYYSNIMNTVTYDDDPHLNIMDDDDDDNGDEDNFSHSVAGASEQQETASEYGHQLKNPGTARKKLYTTIPEIPGQKPHNHNYNLRSAKKRNPYNLRSSSSNPALDDAVSVSSDITHNIGIRKATNQVRPSRAAIKRTNG